MHFPPMVLPILLQARHYGGTTTYRCTPWRSFIVPYSFEISFHFKINNDINSGMTDILKLTVWDFGQSQVLHIMHWKLFFCPGFSAVTLGSCFSSVSYLSKDTYTEKNCHEVYIYIFIPFNHKNYKGTFNIIMSIFFTCVGEYEQSCIIFSQDIISANNILDVCCDRILNGRLIDITFWGHMQTFAGICLWWRI